MIANVICMCIFTKANLQILWKLTKRNKNAEINKLILGILLYDIFFLWLKICNNACDTDRTTLFTLICEL